MKTKAEQYFDDTEIPCDSYLTREIVINMLAEFAEQQVKLCNKPAVSGSLLLRSRQLLEEMIDNHDADAVTMHAEHYKEVKKLIKDIKAVKKQ